MMVLSIKTKAGELTIKRKIAADREGDVVRDAKYSWKYWKHHKKIKKKAQEAI